MNLPETLKDTVDHGSYRYPFAIHEATSIEQEHIMLYLHWHPEAELLMLLDGDTTLLIDDRPYDMHAGDVIFVPPYTLHVGHTLESHSCHFVAVVFQLSALSISGDQALNDAYIAPMEKGVLRFPEHFTEDTGWQGRIRELTRELAAYINVPAKDCELIVRGKLLEIWHHLYTHADRMLISNPDYDRIQPAIRYMREYFRNPITISELAKQCSLSVSRFSYLFQKEMHISAIPYLQKYRIHQSCALLLSTDMTIAAIAMETGFGNLSNFNRNFLRVVHCTPSEFRDEARALRRQQEEQTIVDDVSARM